MQALKTKTKGKKWVLNRARSDKNTERKMTLIPVRKKNGCVIFAVSHSATADHVKYGCNAKTAKSGLIKIVQMACPTLFALIVFQRSLIFNVHWSRT